MDTLSRLEATIALRRLASPDESYVAKLHAKGLPKIAQKLGEEEWGKLRSLLSAADRGLAQSELFTERGSSRAGETDSFTALDKAIKARMEETQETYVDAAAWVSKNKSELMRAYYSE